MEADLVDARASERLHVTFAAPVVVNRALCAFVLVATPFHTMGRKHVVEDMVTDSEEEDLAQQPLPGDEEGDTSASDDPEGYSSDFASEGEAREAGAVAAPPEVQAAAPQLPPADGVAALLNGDVGAEAAVLDVEIQDLLAQVAVDYAAHTTAITSTLHQLRTALASLPHQPVTAAEAQPFLNGWGADPAFSLMPAPPTQVTLVGSWPQHTAVNPAALDQLAAGPGQSSTVKYGAGQSSTAVALVVDVAVQVPTECLQHKDHLNYRWHSRRALYLLAMSRHLSQHPLTAGYTQQLQPFQGDPQRPVLWLTSPAATSSSSSSSSRMPLAVQVIPVLPADAFPVFRLAPDRNSLRWLVKQDAAAKVDPAADGGQQQSQPEGLPTPQYNAVVLQDMLLLEHSRYVAARLQQLPGAGPALLLLKTWAHQCGVSVRGTPATAVGAAGAGPPQLPSSSSRNGGWAGYWQCDGFSGHLLALVVLAAAERTGAMAAVMTPLQLFRAALQLLSDRSTWSKGIALAWDNTAPVAVAVSAAAAAGGEGKQQGQAGPPPGLSAFKKRYSVVLVDHTGWVNAAAGVSASCLSVAATAADRTLAALRSTADPIEVFQAAFLTPRAPHSGFDYYWQVNLPSQTPGQQVGEVVGSRAEEQRVEGLVRAALKGRATLVRVLPRQGVFPPSQLPPAAAAAAGGGSSSSKRKGAGSKAAASTQVLAPAGLTRRSICVGVLVEPVQCLRLVDVGPAADDAKAAGKWQALWGDRSELRRFQDGRICEVVAWDVGPDLRHTIPDLAVTYLLGRHLPPCTTVNGCAGVFDRVLQPRRGFSDVAASRAADAALDKLSKQLRALSDVALKVVSVQPLSAVSRHTPGFYPQPHPLAGGSLGALAEGGEVARCVEPLEVLVQLEGSGRWPDNQAAYLKMKAALGVQLATALAAATSLRVEATEGYLDVSCQGYVYRLYLFSERDEAMHGRAGQPQGLTGQPSQQQHHRHAAAHAPPRALQLAWHQGLVSSVVASNAAFGPACRLAKRWVGAQLLLGAPHLCEEAVELLVVAAFDLAAPWARPASRMAGLLSFLRLLGSWPWAAAPLLVDPAKEVGQEARRGLHREFGARAAAGAAPAMFLATPRDLHASRWTLGGPSQHVLQHLAAVARRAESALSQLLALGGELPGLLPAAAGDATQPSSSSSSSMEKRLAAAWLQVFVPPLQDFDAFVVLRKEAVPFSEHLLGVQSSAWKAMQQQLELGAGHCSSSRKRGRAEAEVAAAAAAAGDAPPKQARAVLKSFPQQLLVEAPTEQLVQELLVGFDPVKLYVQALTERYGHLAIFCCDSTAGLPVVAVKWRPDAFVPHVLRPALAQGSMQLSLTTLDGVRGAVGRPGPRAGFTVPNVPQVLHEMQLMGLGLVQRVLLKGQ